MREISLEWGLKNHMSAVIMTTTSRRDLIMRVATMKRPRMLLAGICLVLGSLVRSLLLVGLGRWEAKERRKATWGPDLRVREVAD